MEAELLQAVRDHLRTTCGFASAECEIEHDEIAPAEVGKLYVAVMPNGWTDGPLNNSSGGIIDEIYSVAVSVIARLPGTPRDRQRETFLDGLRGINTYIRQIRAAVHKSTALTATANSLMIAAGATVGLTEMLKFSSVDPKPRVVDSEMFAARAGEKRAGMVRTVYFSGARWIQHAATMK